jgi:hypothetical protein
MWRRWMLAVLIIIDSDDDCAAFDGDDMVVLWRRWRLAVLIFIGDGDCDGDFDDDDDDDMVVLWRRWMLAVFVFTLIGDFDGDGMVVVNDKSLVVVVVPFTLAFVGCST